jgi:hypothetical protein
MRVLTDTAGMLGWLKRLWPRIVQQEKRIDSLVQLVAWEEITYRKSISDHVS